MKSLYSVSLALVLAANAVQANPLSITFPGLNKSVPDGSAAGIADTEMVSVPFTQLTSIRVTLTITGRDDFYAFNGDLYATLVHDGGFSILLNRPGRTSANLYGNPDNGFIVTLSDSAANGDIHQYAAASPVTFDNQLLGTWSPDGRTADPADALDTSPRPALLSEFLGLNPNGAWTLFVADVETGGLALVDSWSLQLDGINPSTVPESSTYGAMALGLLAVVESRLRSRAAASRRTGNRT